MEKKFYITTAIPYVNAAPHIGHALEFIQTDVLARFHKSLGKETYVLSGSDENAIKNVQAAEKNNTPIQEFIDKNAVLFEELAHKLSVHFDVFQKGSNTQTHYPSSQKLWQLCEKNGDIYKKDYTGLYCVGCETFYAKEELNEKGECFEHPGKKLETISESNYFFKLSKYRDQIKNLIETNQLTILPDHRKNEVLSFLNQPLQDISISRSNTRAKNWGVPVPNDNSQRIYVWFDALNIYQSGVGFGWNEQQYNKWWPADMHVIGKGIIRFHAVYWIAFLLSAGLKLPRSLFVHGYITVDGQKMSKTLGNVVDPMALIEKYGKDAVRYYLIREIPTFGDGDFSDSRMKELYNSELANELGNLVSRITNLAEKDSIVIDEEPNTYDPELKQIYERGDLSHACIWIWGSIKKLNKDINETAPWKKPEQERKNYIVKSIQIIRKIAYHLQPIIPDTASLILEKTKGPITKIPSLFPRLIS